MKLLVHRRHNDDLSGRDNPLITSARASRREAERVWHETGPKRRIGPDRGCDFRPIRDLCLVDGNSLNHCDATHLQQRRRVGLSVASFVNRGEG